MQCYKFSKWENQYASYRLEGEAPMNSDLHGTTWTIWCCRCRYYGDNNDVSPDAKMMKLVMTLCFRPVVPIFGGGEVQGQIFRWRNIKISADMKKKSFRWQWMAKALQLVQLITRAGHHHHLNLHHQLLHSYPHKGISNDILFAWVQGPDCYFPVPGEGFTRIVHHALGVF